MRIKKRKGTLAACLAALACATLPATAQQRSTSLEASTALGHLAACDSSFFTYLGAHPNAFGPSVEMPSQGVGKASAPLVADPLRDGSNVQTLKTPVSVAGLNLVAWRNEVGYNKSGPMKVVGAQIWWGFDVDGTADEVAHTLNRLAPPGLQLKKEKGMWARADYRRVGEPMNAWTSGGESSTITPKGTIERAFVIEPHDVKGRVKLYCTLQGSVNGALLMQLRPDLSLSQLPEFQ